MFLTSPKIWLNYFTKYLPVIYIIFNNVLLINYGIICSFFQNKTSNCVIKALVDKSYETRSVKLPQSQNVVFSPNHKSFCQNKSAKKDTKSEIA